MSKRRLPPKQPALNTKRPDNYAVDPATGLMSSAAQCHSPNHDERPADDMPNLVIIHGISLPPGEFGGPHVEALFQNRLDPSAHPYFARVHELRVSAHLLIDRPGGVKQFVAFLRRAWHAGVSSFQGRRC